MNGVPIQTILLTVNLVAVIGGGGVLWGVQSSRIDGATAALTSSAARMDAIEQRNVEHYQSILGRVSSIESDIKYLSQGIAELKLRKRD